MEKFTLDPIGYFLIRINQKTKKIEVAFCKYEGIKFTNPKAKFGKNTINKKISSSDPIKILKWIKAKELYSRKDHYNYMKRELEKAKECIEKGEKYTQD